MARSALELMDGETVVHSWRSARGYLVLTNLRCVRLWKHAGLLQPEEWRSGPTFFLYDLPAPVVISEHFVELREGSEDGAVGSRFRVEDPRSVCAAIAAQTSSGRAEWARRRTLVAQQLTALRSRWPGRPGVIPATHPCAYCGNPVDEGRPRCPSCGAPQD